MRRPSTHKSPDGATSQAFLTLCEETLDLLLQSISVRLIPYAIKMIRARTSSCKLLISTDTAPRAMVRTAPSRHGLRSSRFPVRIRVIVLIAVGIPSRSALNRLRLEWRRRIRSVSIRISGIHWRRRGCVFWSQTGWPATVDWRSVVRLLLWWDICLHWAEHASWCSALCLLLRVLRQLIYGTCSAILDRVRIVVTV